MCYNTTINYKYNAANKIGNFIIFVFFSQIFKHTPVQGKQPKLAHENKTSMNIYFFYNNSLKLMGGLNLCLSLKTSNCMLRNPPDLKHCMMPVGTKGKNVYSTGRSSRTDVLSRKKALKAK